MLIYVGVADFMCNHQGNEAWTLGMEWDSQAEFNNATLKDFISDRKVAGSTRSVGKGAGDLTYLNIFDAGHMVSPDSRRERELMQTRFHTTSPRSRLTCSRAGSTTSHWPRGEDGMQSD